MKELPPAAADDLLGPSEVDLTLAIIAGPRRWMSGGWPPPPALLSTYLTSVIGLVGVGTVTSLGWLSSVALERGSAQRRVVAVWLLVALLGAFFPVGSRWQGGVTSVLPEALVRGALIAALVGLSLPIQGLASVGFVGALGLFLGSDASITLSLLGVDRVGTQRRSILAAPAHWGTALSALGGSFALSRLASIPAAKTVVVIEASVLIGFGVWWLHLSVAQRHTEHRQLGEQAIRDEEHRLRSHWIHDDVLSELRMGRLTLEQGQLDQPQLAALLTGMDHRLRLRQLDEVLAAGHARIAEIVQPFVRLIVSSGVTLLSVPNREKGSLEIETRAGQLFKRSLAVLVTNSLVAGARSMSIAVYISPTELTLVVDDDAGGFDPSPLHAGRGLDVLGIDLDPGIVTTHRHGVGTRAISHIHLTPTSPGQRKGTP